MCRPVISGIRSIIGLALGLSVAACSSAATPTPRTESTYIPGVSRAMTLTTSAAPFVKTFSAPLEAVWRAIPAAYDSLGIQLTLADPKTHSIGNEGFKARQRLGGARISTYIECGTTQVGPNADSYEVFFTVMTSVEAVGPAESRVTTTMTAAAKPMQFAQDYSRCSSKEVLEARLMDVIAAVLKP